MIEVFDVESHELVKEWNGATETPGPVLPYRRMIDSLRLVMRAWFFTVWKGFK